MAQNLIEIDGSILEGGGQILRVALTLSCIKRTPVRIFNIRSGRSKPGLMEQHLKGVELVRDLSSAKVCGAEIGSTEITFHPGNIVGGSFNAFVKTAGSVSLLLQVALPCALYASSGVSLRLRGGTNAEMAPQVDYMTEVFRPVLEKFGGTFDFELIRRGYFPKGGGEVEVHIRPVKELIGAHITQPGSVSSITGWSFVAGTLPPHLANKIAAGAIHFLAKKCQKVDIESYKEDPTRAPDNAAGIILVAYTDTNCILGGDALLKRNESAEKCGERAATNLFKAIEQGACVDEHCQDQIVVIMAIAKGPSSVKVGEVTLHTKTAIHVAEIMTQAKFNIEQLEGGGNIIYCTGDQSID